MHVFQHGGHITKDLFGGVPGVLGGGGDSVAPTCVVTSAASVVYAAFTATFTFSEVVTGFDAAADITVTNGTAGDPVDSGDGITYTATITPSALGAVTVKINASVCTDVAGNPNEASNTLSVTMTDWMFTITTTTSPQTLTLTRVTPTGSNLTVYWGDGTTSTINAGYTGGTAHEYATAGTYQLSISNMAIITYLRVEDQSIVGGDISGWTLPNLTIFDIANTSVSGDISSWTLPSTVGYIYLDRTGVSGDISSWSIPAGLNTLSLYNTSVSGTPNISANTTMREYRIDNCGLLAANVDAILASVYANRADFTYATPALNVGGTNAAPSGAYADEDPPTTGLGYVYELANDPETEGFNTWTITYTGGTAP